MLHTLHFTIHTLHFHTFTPYTSLYNLANLNFPHFTLRSMESWPSSCIFIARTPTSSCPQLRLCTALLIPALPKVHSDAEGGPLHLPQSLVIMLAMLNFLILFVQQYIRIICSHPRPLQHTLPQYLGLDGHLTNMPQLQTSSSTLTKKLHSYAVPSVFSCQTPCQTSFRPLPLGLK